MSTTRHDDKTIFLIFFTLKINLIINKYTKHTKLLPFYLNFQFIVLFHIICYFILPQYEHTRMRRANYTGCNAMNNVSRNWGWELHMFSIAMRRPQYIVGMTEWFFSIHMRILYRFFYWRNWDCTRDSTMKWLFNVHSANFCSNSS